MISLNIETSTTICSASITENGLLLHSCRSDEGNHAKQLPLFAIELLDRLHKEGKTLDAVSISQGPGSYTGLRIGTATAKGICYGLDIPLIPIDTLAIFCKALAEDLEESTVLCPMIDARRMEVYCALYERHDRYVNQLTEITPQIITAESFSEVLKERPIIFFGNGSAKCRDILTHPNAHFIENITPDAAYMGILAEQASRVKHFADTAYFEPFYLKDFRATVSHKAQDVLKRER